MKNPVLSFALSVPFHLGMAGLAIFLLVDMTTVDAKGRSPVTLMSYDGGKTYCQGPMATCKEPDDCCRVLEQGESGNYSCVDGVCCLEANDKCYYDGECCNKMVCGEFDSVTGLGKCKRPKRSRHSKRS